MTDLHSATNKLLNIPNEGMYSAPRDRKILAFNAFYGWYMTQYDLIRDAWPMYADNRKGGVWYPEPSHWMELPDRPEG
jgi:hypothetical protein